MQKKLIYVILYIVIASVVEPAPSFANDGVKSITKDTFGKI